MELGIKILIYIVFFLLFLDEIRDKDTGKVSSFVIIPIIIPIIAVFYYYTSYSEEMELVFFFLLRVIVGTYLLFAIIEALVVSIVIALGFGYVEFSKEKERMIKVLIIVMSLVSIIIINYFFGDNIILFLKNNWYYFLAGFIVVVLIYDFVANFKKKTPK
jgi:hypothetical protein